MEENEPEEEEQPHNFAEENLTSDEMQKDAEEDGAAPADAGQATQQEGMAGDSPEQAANGSKAAPDAKNSLLSGVVEGATEHFDDVLVLFAIIAAFGFDEYAIAGVLLLAGLLLKINNGEMDLGFIEDAMDWLVGLFG